LDEGSTFYISLPLLERELVPVDLVSVKAS
jgi:hypothetical protein